MSTETELAYLAGIIDGEGTINMFRSGNCFLSRLDVYNTKEELIDWIVARFGGYKRHVDRGVNQPCFTWSCPNHMQRGILLSVFPYLVIKRRQAEILIAFRDGVKPGRPGKGKEFMREVKQGLVDECRELNRRGRHVELVS